MQSLISYLVTELGLAANTVEAYRCDLEMFQRTLNERSLKDFTLEDIASFVRTQSQLGRKASTIRRRLAAIRALLHFQALSGRPVEPLLLAIDPPKSDGRKLPNVLGSDATGALIAAPRGKLATRDIAILELLYAAGLRATELVGLRKSAVNVVERWVRVIGKGNKERVVPIGKAAVEAILRYWADRDTGELAFVSTTGKEMDRFALAQLVKRAHRRSRLAQPVSAHTLRHCFASHLLSGGANFRVVQELMGHSNVNTTMVYTHVDLKRLKEVHKLLGR